MANDGTDFANLSMLDLFRIEAEGQTAILSACLLQLEQQPGDAALLEQLMRAAHSIKGAARMVGIDIAVRIAHAMEDCFVAAQQGTVTLGADQIDTLLKGVDTLKTIATTPAENFSDWLAATQSQLDAQVGELAGLDAPRPRQAPATRQRCRRGAHATRPSIPPRPPCSNCSATKSKARSRH